MTNDAMALRGGKVRAAFRSTAVLAIVSAIVVALATNATARRNSESLSVADGTFAGTTTATLSSTTSGFKTGDDPVFVVAQCYQGVLGNSDDRVYFEAHEADSSGYAGPFTLGPTNKWQSGAADCLGEARLWTGSHWRTIATDTFHVAG